MDNVNVVQQRGSVENFHHLLGFQTHDDNDYQDLYQPGGARRGGRRNRGFSSYAPAFTKEQYMQAAFKFVLRPLKPAPKLAKAKSTTSEASS